MAQPSSILSADRGRASATAWGILSVLLLLQAFLVVSLILSHPKLPSRRPAATAATAAVAPPAEIHPPAGVAPPVVTPAPPIAPATPLAAPAPMLSPPPVGSLAPLTPAAPAAPVSPTAPPPIGSFVAPGMTMPAPAPVATPLPPPAAPPAAPPASLAPAKKSAGPPHASSTPPGTGKLSGVPQAKPAPAAMTLQEMVDLAKQVRGLGDMQGALEVLKRADLQFPNNPAVLAETAQCYEQMGLPEKAAAHWRQLEAMNPAQAAGYRDLAARRLNTPAAAPVATAPASNVPDGPKVLSLGACQATRDPSVVTGEKVVLRIPVLRQGNSAVDPNQVDIDVFFFDRVNGEKVAQTIADEPVTNWGAPPVDWSGVGEEPLDVTYFLPQLTSGEIQAHGRRSYHGYVVKLYYQHKLQDVSAEPRDLLDFGSHSPARPAASGGNPLLPPVTN